ncbi:Peptidase inhibitor I78 family protein [Jannaschia seosinensis]|uniref:Peptidase inhibitor I78 family protein n=2 Tax=Jannaschia seosinensis TaxID=313367 RepID=A0A0M7B6V3_9RHOB|nr:Peptidase inhibitor I78 family protein [Jannaschia seosinensis]
MRRMMVILLMLGACNEATGKSGDECGADGYRGLVGANIAAVTLPAELNDRVIGPDTMVTMDYDPTRLNIRVDEDGRIVELYCG